MSFLKESYDEVHNKVKTLINDVDCLPDWETMIEYEFIRNEGKFNMFSLCSHEIQRYAFDHGLYHLVTWIDLIKRTKCNYLLNLEKAYQYYESVHGKREKWITDDLKHKVKITIKENKIRQLKEELQRLEQDDD